MVISKYRSKFQFLIDGPANLFIKLNVRPNQTSIFAFFISVLGAFTLALPEKFLLNYIVVSPRFYFWWGWIPVILFGLGSYLDIIDGTIARKTERASHYGAFLDSTLDRLSDGFIIFGLIIGKMIWPWENDWKLNSIIGIFSLLIVLLISYTRSRAEIEGVEMKGIGFMERPERIMFIVGAYLIHWIVFCFETQYGQGWESKWIFPGLYVIFIGLCFYTFSTRMIHVYHFLKKLENPTQ